MRKFLEVQGSPATKRVPCDQMGKGTRETKETGAQTVRQAECREFGLLLLVQNWRPVGASRSCGSYCLGFALLKKRLWSPVFQYGPVPYWQQWLPMASIGIVRERSLHNWKTMQLQVSCCWRERTCQAILKGRNAWWFAGTEQKESSRCSLHTLVLQHQEQLHLVLIPVRKQVFDLHPLLASSNICRTTFWISGSCSTLLWGAVGLQGWIGAT